MHMTITDDFSALGLSEQMLTAVRAKGFETPTAIQKLTIPHLLTKTNDIIAQSQTGTGKTAAYGLPILQSLEPARGPVQAIILVPTRELALQAAEELLSYNREKRLSITAIYGGAAMSEQAEAALEAVQAIGRALGYVPQEHVEAKTAKKAAKAETEEVTVYEVEGKPVVNETINTAAFVQIVDKMADIVIENEVPFCEADKMGDGDFGMSIAKGFRQLKADWATRKKGDIGQFLVSCSEIIKEYCGGASGPIWGSAFKYAGKAMLGKKEVNLTDIALLFTEANRGVYETGKKSFGKGAEIGDKTLVDALKPCAMALTKAAEEGKKLQEGLDLGAKAAHEGAEATKTHVATLGRAGTVGERSIGYPDAGAHGLDVIFNELAAYIAKM